MDGAARRNGMKQERTNMLDSKVNAVLDWGGWLGVRETGGWVLERPPRDQKCS